MDTENKSTIKEKNRKAAESLRHAADTIESSKVLHTGRVHFSESTTHGKKHSMCFIFLGPKQSLGDERSE